MKFQSVYLQRVESALSESSDLLKLHLHMTKMKTMEKMKVKFHVFLVASSLLTLSGVLTQRYFFFFFNFFKVSE